MLTSLKTAFALWKFRARMAAAARGPKPADAATAQELDRLVALQTACWQDGPPLTPSGLREALHALNERSISAFVFSVRGTSVGLRGKGALSEDPVRRSNQRSFRMRAMMYRAYIEKTLRRGRWTAPIDFAIDVNDFAEDSAELPIFSFQKARGARNLLMPDVDFFHAKWYREDRDPLRYAEKANSACFVGASTGGDLSVQSILGHETPRLRAAAHFHGNPRVRFEIAKAVQCLSEEAEDCLRSQPYFRAPVAWEDQLRHRFLISMDGNGAACSRLVKGLMSNSAVIKFDSPHELYYFPALQPGRDYIAASREEDVERVLDRESADPGTYEAVAESGKRFASKYLTISSVMDYTVRLLKAYAELTRPRA